MCGDQRATHMRQFSPPPPFLHLHTQALPLSARGPSSLQWGGAGQGAGGRGGKCGTARPLAWSVGEKLYATVRPFLGSFIKGASKCLSWCGHHPGVRLCPSLLTEGRHTHVLWELPLRSTPVHVLWLC